MNGITDTSTSTNGSKTQTKKTNQVWEVAGQDYNSYEAARRAAQANAKAGKDSKIKVKTKMATGGLITKPTHALIGETGKPEAVLNPEQTRILRNNILSSRPDSLVSLLKSYNEAYHGLSASTYDSISNNTNNATVIERAEVNLHVAQLANDYDSKRAANTIMDEMLRIAAKQGATSSVRR